MEPVSIEKIYTEPSDIDKKFKEQEHIIQKMMAKHNKDVLRSIKAQKQQTFFSERIILILKAIALITFNFLIGLLAVTMWTSFYINSYEFNDPEFVELVVTNAHNKGEEIINWILKRIFKFALPLAMQFICTYVLIKNSYFPPSSPPNGEPLSEVDYEEIIRSSTVEKLEDNIKIQEVLSNMENFLDRLKSENLRHLDIIDRWSSENSNEENILASMEADTQRILAELESNDIPLYHPTPEGVESTNNVSDPDNKYDTNSVGRNLIISASILGSSMIISSIAPTLLEFLIKGL